MNEFQQTINHFTMTMNEFQIMVSALGTAIIFVEVLNLGKYIKRMIGKSEFDFMKPFDCIPCMTFWFSIIYSIVFFDSIATMVSGITLSIIVVYLFDKYTN